ncbi:MAG: replication initiation protein [Candidatus Sedimenticola sp. (ex Thyasira tokunagai)]
MAKNKNLKKPDSNLATQSNVLVEASYRMSVPAKRVMLMLLSQIHPGQKDVTGKIKIEAVDYAERTGVATHQAYVDIKKGCRELMRIIITTHNPKEKTSEECVVVQWMKYHDNQGWLEATFTQWISPYIHYLTKIGYTTIAVDDALRFRRFYTIRLYELMMQFNSTGERHITIENLRSAFQIEDGKYSRFIDLKNRVIDPSVNEIEKKTGWQISWDRVKSGRTITGLSFVFEKKQQKELPL